MGMSISLSGQALKVEMHAHFPAAVAVVPDATDPAFKS
jgi:hypothetical protein